MRVLLADDHDMVRDSYKLFKAEIDSDIEFSEARSFDETLSGLRQTPAPDLVLLDLRMPGMTGMESISTVCAAAPQARVVIVSGHYTREDVRLALQLGAVGYIPKTMSGQALINALKLVLGGGMYVPPILVEETDESAVRAGGDGSGLRRIDGLTKREREVLRQVVGGETNKEIAARLRIEEITVKIHLRNVYKKLGARNRADAVRIALSEGETG